MPGGGAAVKEALRRQALKQAIDTSVDLNAAKQAQVEARQELAELANGKYAGSFRARAQAQADAEAKLEKGRDDAARARLAIAKPGGTADQTVGAILEKAQRGGATEQATAQRQLAYLLRKAKLGNLAGDIESVSPRALTQADAEIAEAEQFGERAKAGGEARRRKAATEKARQNAEKARLAAIQKEVAEIQQSPQFKENEEKLKRQGNVDRFGRRFGQEGFDAASAAEVGRAARAAAQHKATAGQAGAKQSNKLPEMFDKEKARAETERRYTESLARMVQQTAASNGIGLNDFQARDIASQSVQLQKQGLNANAATLMAMQRGLEAMQRLAAQFQEQQAMANQMAWQFANVGPTAQNVGGPR